MGSRFAVWLNGQRTVKFITIEALGLGLTIGATSAAEYVALRIIAEKTAETIKANLNFMS